MDENQPWDIGASADEAIELRKTILYDVLFSGGHIECYFGCYAPHPGGDLTVEEFRTRSEIWEYSRDARELMEGRVPFWRMWPKDHLLAGESQDWGGGEVFVDGNDLFAIYLPHATDSGVLDLTQADGSFVMRWFDPRQGATLASIRIVPDGGMLPLGAPPSQADED
ncbi:MAG: hypothetical protein ACI835_000855 [Planctomycetota bacterium]